MALVLSQCAKPCSSDPVPTTGFHTWVTLLTISFYFHTKPQTSPSVNSDSQWWCFCVCVFSIKAFDFGSVLCRNVGFPRPGPDVTKGPVCTDGSRPGEGSTEAQVALAADHAEQRGQNSRCSSITSPSLPTSFPQFPVSQPCIIIKQTWFRGHPSPSIINTKCVVCLGTLTQDVTMAPLPPETHLFYCRV